jgi:nicotinate-nucleotide adenylyltransferase
VDHKDLRQADGDRVTKVAIYGGSFDPPQIAHVLVATYVHAVCDVDEIWVLPAFKHPFGKKLTDFDTRVRLCRKAFHDHLSVHVLPYEEDVGTGFTLDVVKYLRKKHPENEFRLILGSDLIPTLHKWHGFMEETVKLAPPIFVARLGFEVAHPDIKGCTSLRVGLSGVSSTEVRAKVAKGEDISQLVPRAVVAEIKELRLYK